MPPVIDKTKCISCTTCAQICPLDVYGPVVKGQIPEVLYPNECWHCRACEFDCPVGAISFIEREAAAMMRQPYRK